MANKFLKIVGKDYENILNSFIEKHTTFSSAFDVKERDQVHDFYKKILFHLTKDEFSQDEFFADFENLARYKVSLDTPYILMTNEIYALKNALINEMNEQEVCSNIIALMSLFKNINNRVAYIYLNEYIYRLKNMNTLRIVSLSDLIEKNIITYYESHLVWLTQLAIHISNEDKENFVELDEKSCTFGKWLHGDGKTIIQNNSKYKAIETLHNNLHHFARKIHSHIGDDEHHIKITYLEKCELLSLSIGTELALLDNVIMNKQVTKDALTGALNRNVLRGVFQNQYELALATGNQFVIGVCDLDHFKKVNDTHGHVAGDRILKNFVNITKKLVRSSDIIIRYGGEEFVVILPTLGKKKGFEVLERVCKNFRDSFVDVRGKSVYATVSIGMMEIKPQKEFKDSLLDEYIMIADQQLYKAKNNGRDKVESY